MDINTLVSYGYIVLNQTAINTALLHINYRTTCINSLSVVLNLPTICL